MRTRLVPNMVTPIVIQFFMKPECPLCEDVSNLLEVAGHHWTLEVRSVNILTDRTLYDLYWNRIPVLEFDNGATMEAPITREKLTGCLRRMANL